MDWSSVLMTLIKVGAPLLGTAVTALVLWLLRSKLKLQISAEQEKLLADILHKAISFAEEWARSRVKSGEAAPSGAEKLQQATEFAKKEVARVGIKLSDTQVDSLLHAALGTLRQ